jgi:antitoxin component HigA of HigAB toxin-antitoxin module
MIDGRRSLSEIAAALAQQWGVPAELLMQELRPFLARLPFD